MRVFSLSERALSLSYQRLALLITAVASMNVKQSETMFWFLKDLTTALKIFVILSTPTLWRNFPKKEWSGVESSNPNPQKYYAQLFSLKNLSISLSE